jgi:hypothetical protein
MEDLSKKYEYLIGKRIKINHLSGEDHRYDGKEGIVERVDSMGDLHGTWGGLAVIPREDDFEVLN